MLSSFGPKAALSTNRDHYESANGLERYLQHYPEERYNQGRLKDKHKLEEALHMPNGAGTNINNVKRPQGSGPLVCQEQLSRFIGHLFETSKGATIEAKAQENI